MKNLHCRFLISFLAVFIAQTLSTLADSHRFMVTFWELPAQEQTFYFSSSQAPMEKLEITTMSRSKVCSVEDGKVVIHSKKGAAVEKVATVGLDATNKCSLIVLKAKEAGGFETIVINDDPTSIPYGSYLFYNHSELKINGKLGASDIKLKPKSVFLVKPSAKQGASLGFELWHMTENKKTYLQRNTFQYNTNKYLIIFLYSEKTSNGKLSLKSKGLVKFKGG